MRKSLIITVLIMLLCLCGCEAVSPVLESSEPQKASNTLLATIAEAESTHELEATTTSSVDIDVPETNDEESGTPTDVEPTESESPREEETEEQISSEGLQPSFEPVEAERLLRRPRLNLLSQVSSPKKRNSLRLQNHRPRPNLLSRQLQQSP